MAYILGFTFADGNVYKTTLAWDLKKDRKLLDKINQALNSNYPIRKGRNSFRLRITNPVIIHDLEKRGVLPNKSKSMSFPKIPNRFLSHFIRGYFDGDGWIYLREKRGEISIGFCSGSSRFLNNLVLNLNNVLGIKIKAVRERKSTNGRKAEKYQLDYYNYDAYKILNFIYQNLKEDSLFLRRKFERYLNAKEIYKSRPLGTRKWRFLEDKFGIPIKKLLYNLVVKQKMSGMDIVRNYGVPKSSVYRWLFKYGIKRSNG